MAVGGSSLPFYDPSRPILPQLSFEPELDVQKHYANIFKVSLALDTTLPSQQTL